MAWLGSSTRDSQFLPSARSASSHSICDVSCSNVVIRRELLLCRLTRSWCSQAVALTPSSCAEDLVLAARAHVCLSACKNSCLVCLRSSVQGGISQLGCVGSISFLQHWHFARWTFIQTSGCNPQLFTNFQTFSQLYEAWASQGPLTFCSSAAHAPSTVRLAPAQGGKQCSGLPQCSAQHMQQQQLQPRAPPPPPPQAGAAALWRQ